MQNSIMGENSAPIGAVVHLIELGPLLSTGEHRTETDELFDELLDEPCDEPFEVPACRVCGCTEDAACEGGCCWVPDPAGGELCSTCAAEAWAVARQLALNQPVEPEALAAYRRWLDLPVST